MLLKQHPQHSLKKIRLTETTCKNNLQVVQAPFQSRENPPGVGEVFQKRNLGSSKGGQMNIFTNHRAFSSGWFIFTITSGNSWIIQWAPVDYVVSKTLGPPLGEEDRGRGGIKPCLKDKCFNRSGSYPFTRSLRSREGVSISVSLPLRKVVPHRHCHELEMCSSAVNLAKWRQPCLSNTSIYCCSNKIGYVASTLVGILGIPTMCLEINMCFSPGSFPSPTELSQKFLLQSSGMKSCFQAVLRSLEKRSTFLPAQTRVTQLDREN